MNPIVYEKNKEADTKKFHMIKYLDDYSSSRFRK